MPEPGPPSSSPAPVASLVSLLGIGGVLLAGGLAFLQPLPPATPGNASTAAPPAPGDLAMTPATARPCALRPDGLLRGHLFGALDLDVNWSGAGFACDGMHKPDGSGVRLYFSGNHPDHGPLALVLGIDGGVDGMAGTERPANVTVIDGKDSRFFSTAGTGRCWARVASVAPRGAMDGRPAGNRIDGLVYCVGALPEVGDHASLTLGEVAFAGWVPDDAG